MNRPSPLLWFALLLILLLPTAAGRLILDLAGGLMVALLVLPLILAGTGFIGWKILQSRMVRCEVCGVSSFKNSEKCSFCGSELSVKQTNQTSKAEENESIPASSVTIDIKAEEAGNED